MKCSEIIAKLEELSKQLKFLEARKTDKRRVAKRLYSPERLERYREWLEGEYGGILKREYWDDLEIIITALRDPDLSAMGAYPFNDGFYKYCMQLKNK